MDAPAPPLTPVDVAKSGGTHAVDGDTGLASSSPPAQRMPTNPSRISSGRSSRAMRYPVTPKQMKPHPSFAWTPNLVDRTIPSKEGFGSTIDRWNHQISGVTTGGNTGVHTHTSTVSCFFYPFFSNLSHSSSHAWYDTRVERR